ncbi:MAG: 5'/3'-nucleotidase SurE, partial [Deltaproteobacteria bacterium]|nr:5'/3'-nucleotidase SurE [Deltaproteobacteria bacterium]
NLGLSGFIKGEVDLVIAGINKGPNLGEDTEYSGTVSAAKEATLLGVKSFAISLTARNTFFFSTASFVAKEIAKIILEKGLPENTFLNINVPNIPLDEVKSYQITSLGKRDYKSQLVQKRDPRGKLYYWLGGDGDRFQLINGTDFFAIKNGHISITPLIIDRTNYNVMEKLKILIPEKVKVSF